MPGTELAQLDLFRGGQDGYHTYRIPGLVVSNSGTILALCEARRDGDSDAGHIALVLKRSADSGQTWTPMQTVWEEEGNTIGNPCPVLDRDTGAIWLPFCRNNDRVFVMKSDDEGASWSGPVDITAQVKPASWSWYATGPGHGIQLRSGRLLIPCDHREADPMQSHVFVSDDHGASWQPGGSLPELTDECVAAELADGSVYLNMRSYHGKHRRAVARSIDGGATWSETRLEEALIEPVCQAGMVGLRNEAGASTDRLLFSNPAATERERMTVRLSENGGKTWTAGRALNPGPSAYSDLCIAPDASVCCLYERGEAHAYEKLTLARFGVEWVTQEQT